MYQHKKGKIQDSATKALVTDPLFKTRVETPKKGKGSYCRNKVKKETKDEEDLKW